jgi:hypothetical protein
MSITAQDLPHNLQVFAEPQVVYVNSVGPRSTLGWKYCPDKSEICYLLFDGAYVEASHCGAIYHPLSNAISKVGGILTELPRRV